jgi:translation initiation factor 2B subunit (eIF-2B alpha/beta/delta family)
MVASAEKIPQLPPLSDSARQIIRQLLSGEYLGASRNIRQINDLFVSITETWSTPSAEELIQTLVATGNYLIATRGRNTPAIANAIQLTLRNLHDAPFSTPNDVKTLIETRRTEYNMLSLANAELIAECGANLLANSEVVLAFDYSSSIMAILKRVADRGRKLQIIVPESRCLDGGRPIANEATGWGHFVTFIVDMAFGHFIPQADAILGGAETIFANGDCWNTIGSYPVAVMADRYQVPFFVPTELIKVDPLSFMGGQKSIKPHDYRELLNFPGAFHNPELMSVTAPDLDRIPGSLITAYVTPIGVIRPEHVWSEARDFLGSIGASIFPDSRS